MSKQPKKNDSEPGDKPPRRLDIIPNPITVDTSNDAIQPIEISGSVSVAMTDLTAQIIDTTTNDVYQPFPTGLAIADPGDGYDFLFGTVPDGVPLLLVIAGITTDTPPVSQSISFAFTAAVPAAPVIGALSTSDGGDPPTVQTNFSASVNAPANADVTVTGVIQLATTTAANASNPTAAAKTRIFGMPKNLTIGAGQTGTIQFSGVTPTTGSQLHTLVIYPRSNPCRPLKQKIKVKA